MRDISLSSRFVLCAKHIAHKTKISNIAVCSLSFSNLNSHLLSIVKSLCEAFYARRTLVCFECAVSYWMAMINRSLHILKDRADRHMIGKVCKPTSGRSPPTLRQDVSIPIVHMFTQLNIKLSYVIIGKDTVPCRYILSR